ncbi:hypothetical protein HanRHA438_Chr15g0702231 [Helianthus annuus]|nr:hypothetical protein HanIR_Chr15g0749711 [Helianthus annuus]KAJ0844418.1 hypothetical protein HanRHA438_Chr15g0702231 [Helianthus annuus]
MLLVQVCVTCPGNMGFSIFVSGVGPTQQSPQLYMPTSYWTYRQYLIDTS